MFKCFSGKKGTTFLNSPTFRTFICFSSWQTKIYAHQYQIDCTNTESTQKPKLRNSKHQCTKELQEPNKEVSVQLELYCQIIFYIFQQTLCTVRFWLLTSLALLKFFLILWIHVLLRAKTKFQDFFLRFPWIFLPIILSKLLTIV